MRKQEIEKLYVYLQRYAKYKFNEQEFIEDFPGWAITNIIEKGNRNFDFLYTDYLREKYGRIGSFRCNASKPIHQPLRFKDREESYQGNNNFSKNRTSENKFNLELFVELLSDNQRYIAREILIFGEKARDVGTELGITESRVSQIMRGVKDLLRYKQMESEIWKMI